MTAPSRRINYTPGPQQGREGGGLRPIEESSRKQPRHVSAIPRAPVLIVIYHLDGCGDM